MNPWEQIDLNLYEKHMSLESVAQLQMLNQMMKKQFSSYSVSSVMILGIAGGNGLEHIEKEKFQKVYGVDINEGYLQACHQRYTALQDVLETIQADLTLKEVKLPCVDLLIADLLLEYIGYECFQNILTLVKPNYVSVIIQKNLDDSFISDSPYIKVFDGLDTVHHDIGENELDRVMMECDYLKCYHDMQGLPNGKALIRVDYCVK